MRRHLLSAAASCALVTACSAPTPPAPVSTCPTDACHSHAFDTYSLAPGGEIDSLCMSWTLGNDEPLWVNGVVMENDGYFHHSNWFFVPDDYGLGDGIWPCHEGGFSELDAALQGGVLYAQSTQTTSEAQRFVPGAALYLPAHARIIGSTHLLNTNAESVSTALRLTLETVPAATVTAPLTPFRMSYDALELPPLASSSFSASCHVREPFEAGMQRPFELKLHYVLPHFHALGTHFELTTVGGPDDGEAIFALADAYGEPLGHTFAEPLDLSHADGLRFTCGYDNPRDEVVVFGIGDQEMCVMLGFAESGFLWDGNVGENVSSAETEGVIAVEGDCKVLGLPYAPAEQ